MWTRSWWYCCSNNDSFGRCQNQGHVGKQSKVLPCMIYYPLCSITITWFTNYLHWNCVLFLFNLNYSDLDWIDHEIYTNSSFSLSRGTWFPLCGDSTQSDLVLFWWFTLFGDLWASQFLFIKGSFCLATSHFGLQYIWQRQRQVKSQRHAI